MSITNNYFGIAGAGQINSTAFNSNVSGGNLGYSIYPVVVSSSHRNTPSYMNSFPIYSIMFPVPAPYGYLYFYYKNGSGICMVQQSPAVGKTYFTGQHITLPDDPTIKKNLKENVGLIMSSNDTGCTSYNNLGPITGIDAIQINECLPNSTMSSTDNDPCVFGVVVDELNGSNSKIDLFMSDYESNEMKPDIGNSVRVNSLGEGAMWVSNINGAIQNGDLITSSRIRGVGKRQDDDFVYNYTVAKATMSCDFDLQSDKYKTKSIDFEGRTYTMAFVGVVYHCG